MVLPQCRMKDKGGHKIDTEDYYKIGIPVEYIQAPEQVPARQACHSRRHHHRLCGKTASLEGQKELRRLTLSDC